MSALSVIISSLNKSDYQVIATDKKTANKITSAFLTKGWWFLYYHTENYHYIVTSTVVDLNWYSKRGYKFELA